MRLFGKHSYGLLALLVTACAGGESAVPERLFSCLPVAQVDGAQTLRVAGPDDELLYQARLGDYRGQCVYEEDNHLTINVVLPIIFTIEPTFGGDTVAGEVFVGVIDRNEKVIAKSILPIGDAFERARGRHTITQVATIEMGVIDPDTIALTHAIILGFQLSPEALADNRKRQLEAEAATDPATTQIDPVFEDKLPIRITGPSGSLL